MQTFLPFLFDFLTVFFGNLWKGIVGLVSIFNIPAYINAFKAHYQSFTVLDWILSVLSVIVVVALLAGLIWLIYLLIRKYIRFRETLVTKEDMLEEIGNLNRKVVKLAAEKERIMAMKVSQLGLRPEEAEMLEEAAGDEAKEGADFDGRFYKLAAVDRAYENYEPPVYETDFTLEELCERFRNFACSRMGLYYNINIIRLFISAFASTRLIILQGISGTGKTSLAYAFGKFVMNDTHIAPVQPSWRDRTELFGYFNEFTKRFNETEVLKKIYEAGYNDDTYLMVLDEMNIARVEYYFAEMLSILEMPVRSEWVVDLVSSGWPNDPKRLNEGRITLPGNMWYVGTANNDDSTFAITDKVYDRAIPIDINDKGKYFDAPYTEPLRLSASRFEELLNQAKIDHKVSQETLDKLAALDDYVIAHFRLAFGNRIMKQLNDFVPAYVACGGTEIDGLDYILCHKIFRKFESLNLSFIRDEIDGLISYLDKHFGRQN
ncbi:MAG: hypothetical protein IJC52_05320, partial [Clostridia bacterium]|nr:hypothetical protein [Clostridia bacterium]